jgi:tRNA(fMet)-specific endonuclease VapC
MFASGSFAIARNKLASARGETDRLAISTVALFELRFGAENSASPSYHHELMDDFVGHLHVLQFGEAAAHSGEIRAALARSGNLIGPYDLLIAGHARSAGLKLVTGNLREFSKVDGLRCEGWI